MLLVRRNLPLLKTDRLPHTPFMMVTQSASLKLRTSEKWPSSLMLCRAQNSQRVT